MSLAKASANQKAKEVEDTYGDDFDKAYKEFRAAERSLAKFETLNGLDPLSAHYKSDHLMFVSSIFAIVAVEAAANGFFLQELSDKGYLGGVAISTGASITNTLAGLATGFFGLRLAAHRKIILKLLGFAATAFFTSVSLSLLIALADLREATAHGRSEIDFRVIFDPSRWLNYTSIQPFLILALGIACLCIRHAERPGRFIRYRGSLLGFMRCPSSDKMEQLAA